MDTIELGYNSHDLQRVMWNNAIRLGKRSKKGVIDGSTGRKYYGKKASAYRISQEFIYKGKPFHICLQPKFPQLPLMKVVFHLSKYESWNEFFDLAMILCDGMSEDFLNGHVARLDQCVDIELPFEMLRKFLFVKNVCKCFLMNNRGGIESLTLGREPHQIVLYCKETDNDKVDLVAQEILSDEEDTNDSDDEITDSEFNHLDASEGDCKTTLEEKSGKKLVCRIEARHWGKKVPIRRLRDIESLKLAKAFDHICFKLVKPQVIAQLKGAALRDVQAFLYQRDQRSFQMAKLEFSQSKTYQKKVEPYLCTVKLIDFDKAWENRWSRWFGKDFKVPV